jgi:hypothetical protein
MGNGSLRNFIQGRDFTEKVAPHFVCRTGNVRDGFAVLLLMMDVWPTHTCHFVKYRKLLLHVCYQDLGEERCAFW